MENETLQQRFYDIIERVGSFSQDAALTYPSISDYKEMMGIILNTILVGNKGILVYGDFDNDGILSAIILNRFLENAFIAIRGKENASMAKIAFSDRQNSFGLTHDEFLRYQKDSDLVITVDNGSEIPFLTEDLKGKLIVVDHHPVKDQSRRFSFVLNPNTGRINGEKDYSTSGGRITYDLIMNLDAALKHFVKEYREIDNKRQLTAMKELAALTLVSDMALMDKENRAFVASAIETMKAEPTKLPFYTKLSNFSTLEFSFNIISQINAMSRMEKDLMTVNSWVAPKSLEEYKKADAIIQANNEEKKLAVNVAYREYLAYKRNNPEDTHIEYFEAKNAPIGILGLLANKISNAENNKPTIVAGVKRNGDITMSARGNNVKTVLSHILEEGTYGGHAEACGGKIIIPSGSSLNVEFEKLKEKIENFNTNCPPELLVAHKMEMLSLAPLSVSEFKALSSLYADISGGVQHYKNLYLPVSGFHVAGVTTFKSGWSKIGIADDTHQAIDFFASGDEVDPEDFKRSNMVAVMRLTGNSDYSLHKLMSHEEFILQSELASEVTELGITLKDEPVIDILEPKERTMSVTIHDEVFIRTENEKVLLVERYTEEIIASHPDKVFVFSDNMIGKGKAGQAVIRDFDNAIGIPTKRAPSMDQSAFFSDKEDEKAAMVFALNRVLIQMKEGKTVVFPSDGLGTGLAKMEEKSPHLFTALHAMIAGNFTREYERFVRIPSTPEPRQDIDKSEVTPNVKLI